MSCSIIFIEDDEEVSRQWRGLIIEYEDEVWYEAWNERAEYIYMYVSIATKNESSGKFCRRYTYRPVCPMVTSD